MTLTSKFAFSKLVLGFVGAAVLLSGCAAEEDLTGVLC